MRTVLPTLDYDGSPHSADTGERAYGDGEKGEHWIDDLPAVSLAGVVLVTSPNDMVCAPNGKWMRRFEWELAKAEAAGRRLDATLNQMAQEHTEGRIGSVPIALKEKNNG